MCVKTKTYSNHVCILQASINPAAKPLNPIEKSIEPRLVVLVGLAQDMAKSAEFKLAHVEGFKLTHVAASITSSKVF